MRPTFCRKKAGDKRKELAKVIAGMAPPSRHALPLSRVISPFILPTSSLSLARPSPFGVGVSGRQRLHVVKDDPDNRILECAVADAAGVIATGDRALLALHEFKGVRIVASTR